MAAILKSNMAASDRNSPSSMIFTDIENIENSQKFTTKVQENCNKWVK